VYVLASAPNVTINFSEVKVKVQGQNRRTENLPLALARLWITISSPNLAVRQKYRQFRPIFGMKYDLMTKFKTAF